MEIPLGWVLHHTVRNNIPFQPEPEMVKLLLVRGANPNQAYDGMTAWQKLFETCAWRAEDRRIMQLFLDYGADPNSPVPIEENRPPRHTPLGLVVQMFSDITDSEVATLLCTFMERGADHNLKDSFGSSVEKLARKKSSALAAFLEHRPRQHVSRRKNARMHLKSSYRTLCYR